MVGIIARLERGVNGLHDKKQWKNRTDGIHEDGYGTVLIVVT